MSYSLSHICSYHSGVNVGEIVACSSAPASASHLCTVGCQVISVHSSSMNATGLNFLLIVSLLWVYPRWILLASAICAFFNLALIRVVYLRNALLITAFSLITWNSLWLFLVSSITSILSRVAALSCLEVCVVSCSRL